MLNTNRRITSLERTILLLISHKNQEMSLTILFVLHLPMNTSKRPCENVNLDYRYLVVMAKLCRNYWRRFEVT